MNKLLIPDYEKEGKFTCLICKDEFPLIREGRLVELCECKSFRVVKLKIHIEVTDIINSTSLTLKYK